MKKRIISLLLVLVLAATLLPVQAWGAMVITVQSVPEHKQLGCGENESIIVPNCYVDKDYTYYVADDSGSYQLSDGKHVFYARLANVFESKSKGSPGDFDVVLSGHIPLLIKEDVFYCQGSSGPLRDVNLYRCKFCDSYFYGSDYAYTPEITPVLSYSYATNLINVGFVTIPSNSKIGSCAYYWPAPAPDRNTTDGISLIWEKKGIFNGTVDQTKPPYPHGTDAQYAKALQFWAQRWNVKSITQENAAFWLDKPVYIPVDTTGRGDYLLLDDGGTTVRQVINDIVFLENLQTFTDYLDSRLEDITFSDGDVAYYMAKEGELYRTVLSWNKQVQRYLKTRNANSNLYAASQAAQAYEILSILVDKTDQQTYKTYIRPFAKAFLKTTENYVDTDSLARYASFQEYKNVVEPLADSIALGRSAYKVAMKDGSEFSLAYDALTTIFKRSGNDTLEEFAKALKERKENLNAVKLSMLLGSSIGMFPLVVDLYNDMYGKAKDQVCAMYFLADYYMEREYPSVYNALFSDSKGNGSGYPISYDNMWALNTGISADNYKSGANSDPLMYNWLKMWQYREKQWRKDVAGLRRDLTNYALLLRFARSFDANAAKKALVEYLDAEIHSSKLGLGGGGFRCPVTLELYDLNNELAASLSSENQDIPQVPGAAMYLLGDGKEEKYIIFDTSQYTLEVKPYGSGTMDIALTDGAGGITAYQSVPVDVGMVFNVDPLADEKLTVTDESGVRSIPPAESVPVRNITLNGVPDMIAGTTQQMTVTTYPLADASCQLLWSSSQPEVAAVDEKGTATALQSGFTVITVQETGTGQSANFAVYVSADVQSIVFSSENMTLLEGEEQTLALTLQPGTATLHDVKWGSNDPSVAMVDSSGTVYGNNAGETTITAYAGEVEASIQVIVQARVYDTGDVNGDGVVSVLDVASLYTMLTSGWYNGRIENEAKVMALADVNGDDSVDVYDLQLLYENVCNGRT